MIAVTSTEISPILKYYSKQRSTVGNNDDDEKDENFDDDDDDDAKFNIEISIWKDNFVVFISMLEGWASRSISFIFFQINKVWFWKISAKIHCVYDNDALPHNQSNRLGL